MTPSCRGVFWLRMGVPIKTMYARLAVNFPSISGVFDYSLPEKLEQEIRPGCLVTAPFGKQVVQGVVLELVSQPAVAETKSVIELLDPLPVLTASQISFAKWLSRETLSPLAACIGLMLPAGLSQQADVLYSIRGQQSSMSNQQLTATQTRLLALLQNKGSLRGRQIDRHFKNVDWRKTAQVLVKTGVLTRQSILPPPSVRPKYVRTAQLSVPPDVAEAAMPDLGKTADTLTRRQAALRCLIREPADVNVSWVYAESGCNLADLQELAERELIVLRETEIWRDPLEKVQNLGAEIGSPPELTTSQQPRMGKNSASHPFCSPRFTSIPSSRCHRLRQDRDLYPRRTGMYQPRKRSHHPRPGDCHYSSDSSPVPGTLPGAGWAGAFQVV